MFFFSHRVLAVQDSGANTDGRQNVNPIDTQTAIGHHVTCAPIVKCDVAPATMQTGDTIVTFDLLTAPRTLSGGVALYPVVLHLLRRASRLDVG